MKKLAALVFSTIAFTTAAPAYAGDEAYYQQFLYKQECEDDGDGEQHCQYRHLMGMETFDISPLHKINVTISLYLNQDLTATARYSEMHQVRSNTSTEWRTEIRRFCQVEKNGSWSAPTGFAMGDLIGERATWNSQNAVKLTFTKSLDSPEMQGRSIILSYGYANMPKDPAMPPVCE